MDRQQGERRNHEVHYRLNDEEFHIKMKEIKKSTLMGNHGVI